MTEFGRRNQFRSQMRRKLRAIVQLTVLSGFFFAAAILAAGTAQAADGYRAEIIGAPDGLKGPLADSSDLIRNGRAYPSLAALRRAARRDAGEITSALHAAGYYAGAVDVEISEGAGEAPASVAFNLDPGPLFTITGYTIRYEDDGDNRPESLEAAGLSASGAADGAALRDLQERFLHRLWNTGYPNAQIVSRHVEADFKTGEATAVFAFQSGPAARFGETRFEGAENVELAMLRRMRTWEDGARYDRSRLSDYQQQLLNTGLFTSAEVTPGKVGEDGNAPVNVRLTESKLRTIGAGVSYSTADGPGARIFFEHRNLFGRGERLHVELTGSQIEQSVKTTVTKPLPRLDGQAFGNASFINETTDAFNARSVELAAGLSKKWLKDRLETRGSLAFETSNVRADGREQRTYFASAPLSVVWNSEDNPLSLENGVRASFTVTPYVGTRNFTQAELSGRSRVHFGENNRVTLAARALLSGTVATSFDALPVNKRYFSGGGGSVRGYGFQEAGPLDASGDPTGGRSRAEAAVEARVKTFRNIQLAAFIDAGTVSTSALPDFNDRVFFGYGAGVRYLTPIGPIRADIAFPLDPRPGDADFQFYIALGQPF